MTDAQFNKFADQIAEKCGDMTEEQCGHLAGIILVAAGGVSRTTIEPMLKELGEEDLWEIAEQVPPIVNEMMEAKGEVDEGDHESGGEGE